MILERVRLRNVKSFVEQELYFSGGINIIAGRNGAGKSTVIEAVGLALFDSWPQKFKDGNAYAGFIRRGEREGLIEVDVRRGDARYTVRCELGSRTVNGRERIDYERTLLDASGNIVASSGGRKKEFQEDIREHVLGSARIDDDKLFRDIIGTEQGGFDEPFTRTELQRRDLFEKILGIEDFQDFEKQFRALVKLEQEEVKTLDTRAGEHTDLPHLVEEAGVELERRTNELGEAAATLKVIRAEVKTLLASVDGLSARREALQKAEAERSRLEEKQRGEQAQEARLHVLQGEARTAAEAVKKAQPGHEAFLAAEKEQIGLREAVRERDGAKEQLAKLREHYTEKKGELKAAREGAMKQLTSLAEEFLLVESEISAHTENIGQLRTEYARLKEAHAQALSRADFARKVSAYVQDLDTVQRTLDNVGERMHTLSGTLAELEGKQRELSVDITFFPGLLDQARQLFSRYNAEEVVGGKDTPFASMLREAEELERTLQSDAAAAADALSKKEEQGVGEKKLLGTTEKRHGDLLEKRRKLEEELRALDEEAGKVDAKWEQESGAVETLLAKHADLDSRIEALTGRLEEHREAHDEYMKQHGAADTLAQRERDLADLQAEMTKTAKALEDAAARITEDAGQFTEEEYAVAQEALEEARKKEQAATEEHSGWKARVDEQRAQLKALEKGLREYEKLLRKAERARAEASFTSEVHQKVVRELVRHVGASIVGALSGFADELYQRIAPEQGSRLRWDPQNYAVELHRDGEVISGRELSGGQLMGVSLSVKLALIKWYAQCRIGFLDEPTTHLDRDTRAHLSEVIKSLDDIAGDGERWFDQLFVISHEESFQGAGHRIELERDADGVSRVASVE